MKSCGKEGYKKKNLCFLDCRKREGKNKENSSWNHGVCDDGGFEIVKSAKLNGLNSGFREIFFFFSNSENV